MNWCKTYFICLVLFAVSTANAKSVAQQDKHTEASSEMVSVVLRGQVTVNSDEFYLGDIAEIYGKDAGLVSKLSMLKLGKSPRPGNKWKITKESLLYKIKRIVNLNRDQFRMMGDNNYTSVTFAGKVFSSNSYLDEAKKCLQRKLARKYDGVSVVPKGKYENLEIPVGSVEILTSCNDDVEKVKPREVVWTDININGTQYLSLPVWFNVKIFKKVNVLIEPAKKGSILSNIKVAEEVRDISGRSDTIANAIRGSESYRLKRDMKVGDIVTRDILEKIPQVERGKKAIIVSNYGGITISMDVMPKTDGHINEVIEVKKLKDDTDTSLKAKVIGARLLSIDGVEQ